MLYVQFLFWYIAHNWNYGILATPARTIVKTRLKLLFDTLPLEGKGRITRSHEGIKFTSRWKRWQRKFSNGSNYSSINDNKFLGRYAFIRSDVGRKDVLPQLNASILPSQNLDKILHTVVYTKDLWHTTRDFTVKYTDQPKIPPVLVLIRMLVFIKLNSSYRSWFLGVASEF